MPKKEVQKEPKTMESEAMFLSGLVDFLEKETPSLESLPREETLKVAKAMVFDNLKEDLKRRVELAGIDYKAKRESFLSRYKSNATKKAYGASLDALEAWAERAGKNVLELKARDADNFINSLDGSPSTVRLRVSAVSAFYTFLDRDTDGRIRNSFRGTKERPGKAAKVPIVPKAEEMPIILEALSPAMKAAMITILEHGFRVGALPTLEIWGGRFKGESKGKNEDGEIGTTVQKAIKIAGLDAKSPWKDFKADQIRDAFRYATGQLYKAGKIVAPYSIHDLRHYFAINFYIKNHDIYALKEALGHSSIAVTETYLRGLKSYLKGAI